MKHDESTSADKTPRPLSSEQAQKGEGSAEPVLEQADPRTKVVDKVITPTSVKEMEDKTRQINERLKDL